MKNLSKSDLAIVNNLIMEKLRMLRFSILDLDAYEPYISSYDYLEESTRLHKEIDKFTKVRDKISKIMEDLKYES